MLTTRSCKTIPCKLIKEVFEALPLGSALFACIIVVCLSFCLGSAFGQGVQTNCEIFKPFLEAKKNNLTGDSTLKAWDEHFTNLQQSMEKVSEQIFIAYLKGKMSGDVFDSCLDNESNDKLNPELSDVFFTQSLMALLGAKAKDLRLNPESFLSNTPSAGFGLLVGERGDQITEFALAVYELLKSNQILPYKLLGHHSSENPPVPWKGAFDLGRRSVFMNFILVPPEEWLIVFIHEMCHVLDTILPISLEQYAKDQEVMPFFREGRDFAALTESERRLLEVWTLRGLDLGFLGEVRAWRVTYSLYEHGVKSGRWPRLKSYTDFLEARPSQMSRDEYIFRFLDDPEKFRRPHQWPFNTQLGEAVYNSVRKKLRDGELSIEMGALKRFLHEPLGQ